MIVADTNVVSELMRPKPMQAVVEWTSSIGKTGVGITVVTVTEIEYGLARLPAGRRQRDLAARWRGVLRAYADKLLDYQTEDAQATASILAER
ncbi:MAG: PIN domain-containing protein, partial [Bifidobacteriaceae bacterium]|nr:PIN domain-containing protein [Bifidobacteriaceae bacterium]